MKSLHYMLLTRRRRNRRDNQRVGRRQSVNITGWGIAGIFSLLAAVALFVLVQQYSRLTGDLPSIESIPRQLNAQSAVFTRPTQILDRDGSTVLLEIHNPGVQRKYMRLSGVGDTVSTEFVDALLAIEQPDYWTSTGVRFDSLDPQDHPTIAQKLVYQMLLSTEPADARRAIRERLLAMQVVARFGKEQVLEWYINSLDFGYLAYGVEAGAQTYFGKSSATLTLPEAAILAGTAFAPAINPWDSPAGAETLKQEVLKLLALQKKITPAVFTAAVRAQAEITPRSPAAETERTAFDQMALAQLEKILGRSRTERGGLTIQTTLDAGLQSEILCTTLAQLSAVEGHATQSVAFAKSCPTSRLLPLLPPADPLAQHQIAASVAVVDPQTGDVLAMSGEVTSDGAENSLAAHPAGSAITPFIYLDSFTQGLSPATLAWDAPLQQADGSFAGVSLDGKYHGPVSIRKAMVNDYLQPAITQVKQLGWNSLNRMLNTLGIPLSTLTTPQDVLTQSYRLDEIANAYNVLAAGGYRRGFRSPGELYPSLNYIQRIWDEQGVLIWEHTTPEQTAIVSPGLAYLVTDSLSDENVRRQRQEISNTLQFGFPAAVKVGTAPSGGDAWTVGYTPERLVTVWMGGTQDSKSGGQAQELWTAGLWRAVMDRSMEGVASTGFTRPAEVTTVKVCDPGGMLPSADCPAVTDEVFIAGTEPQGIDTLYVRQAVNKETGRLATVFTPLELMEEETFLQIPAEYQAWAKTAGLRIPPQDYDVLLSSQDDPAVHFTSPGMFSYIHGVVELTGMAGGDDFASYRVDIGEGLNPRSWRQVGSDGNQPVTEGKLATLDTAGLQGLYVIRLQVTDRQNRITTALLQVTVDNQAPKAWIEYPAVDQFVERASTPELFIKAGAEDQINLGTVELRIDGVKAVVWSQPPFTYVWAVQPGEHTLQVIAVDQAGNTSESEVVSFYVE